MKRFTLLFAIAALLVAGSLFAQSANQNLTVTVAGLERISVSGNVTIALTDAGTLDGNYDSPVTDNSSSVTWAHNGSGASTKRITVSCDDSGADANDMDITVEGVSIVADGSADSGGDIATGLSRGTGSITLDFSITDATLAGTPQDGTYVYALTYTLQN